MAISKPALGGPGDEVAPKTLEERKVEALESIAIELAYMRQEVRITLEGIVTVLQLGNTKQ